LVADDAEAAVVRRVFRMYGQEGLPHVKIAERLNAEGVPTKTARHGVNGSGTWYPVHISRILNNPIYKGEAH
jgi:site-specific DNA recombinase